MIKLLLLIASTARAAAVTQPRTYAQPLADKINAAGQSATIRCKDDTSCTVSWDSDRLNTQTARKLNGLMRQSLFNEMESIEKKLDTGTATMADLRRAIKILLLLGR